MKRLFIPCLITSLCLLTACQKKEETAQAGPGKKANLNTATNSTPADLAGSWTGTIELDEKKKIALRVVMHFTPNADQGLTGKIDSPDQGAKDIPMTSVLFNAGALQVESEGIAATYIGRLGLDKNEITGHWNQGGKGFPVTFKKGAPKDMAPGSVSYKGGPGDSKAVGYWLGTLDLGENKLRLALRIGKNQDKKLLAYMDSLDQGARDLPAGEVKIDGDSISLAWPLLNAKYKAEVGKAGNEISGTWTQMGKSNPLKMQRTAENANSMVKDLSFKPAPDDVTGLWEGVLEEEKLGLRLRLGIKIGKDPKGEYSGSMDSLDQGVKDLPISTISFAKPDVKLEWKGLKASFEGTLQPDGKTLDGNFVQAGRTFPLKLVQAEAPNQN